IGTSLKNRSSGRSAVPGVPGGNSSYAVSAKKTRPRRCEGDAKPSSTLRIARILPGLMLRDTSRTSTPLRGCVVPWPCVGRRSAASVPPSRRQKAASPSVSRCSVVRRIAARKPPNSAIGIAARRCNLSRSAIRPPVDQLADFPGEGGRRLIPGRRCRPRKHACRERDALLAGAAELPREQLERLALLGDDALCERRFDKSDGAFERRRRSPATVPARREAPQQDAAQRKEENRSREQQSREQRRRDSVMGR